MLVAAECQVVVFDEDGVVETGAVVVSAAAMDGILFQPPPAGSCFAGVINAGRCATNCFDVLARERGDSGKAAE